MQYFTSTWLPKMNVAINYLQLYIQAYHIKLKIKLLDDTHLGDFQRVDWLVHKLTTELHSSYWLDRYADESGSFQNVKEEYIVSTSWHRASKIPDSAVILDEKNMLVANSLREILMLPE